MKIVSSRWSAVGKGVLWFELSAMLFALSSSVQAQQAKNIPRIGYLGGGSAELEKVWLDAFLQGLRELGYSEGKNIVVERRYADGRYDQLEEVAAQLIRLKVDVILAASVAHGVKKATSTIPVVMVVADPIGTGLVSSLARPGGNLTGLSDFHGDLITKRLELLRDVVPSVSRIAFLSNPASPTCSLQMKDLATAAPSLGVALFSSEAKGPDDLAPSFSARRKQRVGALLVCGDQMFNTHRTSIFDLTTKKHLPQFTQRRNTRMLVV